MFIRVLAHLFANNLAEAVEVVQQRVEAHREDGRALARLFVEDITAKNPGKGEPFNVTAIIEADYPTHAQAARAVTAAIQFPIAANDPKALVIVELQARNKK